MFQLNETWASLTQDERDEMNEKDRKGRIKSLAMKYGRRRVDSAQKEVETDAKRSGRDTKKRPITWRELQGRIENTKNTLKPGEVRRYDKAKGKWVSNKEDVDEAAALAVPGIANKVISTGAALWGMYNTINNNQGPGIKDGSGTQKGGVWDSLPKGRTTNKNLKGIANEVRKKMNKDKLKKTIEDLYGPIPEHVSWREKFKA